MIDDFSGNIFKPAIPMMQFETYSVTVCYLLSNKLDNQTTWAI